MQINWESFATYNHDARGIRFKFEDLCRQLFANENLSGNKQFRYLHANPKYTGMIERDKIVPPYNSDPIPEIEDQHYLEKQYDGAMFWLIHSMRFEGMGMYGDFGRYVFQSALHSFDVDDKRIFNYAVYYIQTELGFSEEYFGEHDRHCGSYDRHQTIKTERIGKKYQWITMFNLLARISDHCKMVDRWSYPEKEDVQFEGAWGR